MIDVGLGLVLLTVALPVIVISALGSAFSLRAWPFFTQERIGRDGRRFRFVKLRTLRQDVPEYIDKLQLDQKRIPAFCRFLRRAHLDELPQLFLVLRGKMALVGPRPEMAHLHARMPVEFAHVRTSVRPGCTGLWQVSVGCTGLIASAPEYDRHYLRHRSVRFDLWVLLRTALMMTRLGGCVSLSDVPRWVAPTVRLSETDTIAIPVTAGR